MVGMNGIPKAFTPQSLAQQVADLRREVQQLTSARAAISIGSIVEGGTIDANVGTQLTETVQKEIVVERHNLAEAALTDVVVTGSIATKGQTTENPPRDITVRMTTVSRSIAGQEGVPNPGIIFETDDAPTGLAPGIYSPDGKQLNIGTNGAQGASFVTVRQDGISVLAQDVVIGGILTPLIRAQEAGGGTLTLGGASSAVNLYGNVKVNGAAYGAPQTRVQAPLGTGWTHVTTNGWNGLWVEQMGKWTTITGCVQKSNYAWNDPIAFLPAQYRPANKAPGMNCEIDPAGNLLPGTAGTGARNISISYYAA